MDRARPPLAIASLAACALALVASAAWAASPGPATRESLLPLGVCADDPTVPCLDGFDCDNPNGAPGTCSASVDHLSIFGILTFIGDKDAGPVGNTTPIPLTKDAADNTVPVDFSGSTLTLMLEFSYLGQPHVLAKTFKDLGDFVDPALRVDCRGFCFPTWREPAVETRIALRGASEAGSGPGTGEGGGGGTGGGGGQQAGGSGIRIQWATLPPPAADELVAILGLPPGTVPFVDQVRELDIFDHSAEADLLASVHRMRVRIRFILPEG
jgi:hypothetical protein